MVRYATIGSSWIADAFIEGAKQSTPGLVLSAVYSRTEQRGREFAAKYGVEFLPYHAYAGTKCVFLGREDNGRTDWIPTEEQIGQAKSIVREAGVPIL